MTPRSWAWASASASASPIRSTSRSETAPAASSCASVEPTHELGDEEARAVLLARVEDRDDARVVEPRDRVRLAPGALVGAAVGGDRLDRHGAAEALVARLVDRAEAAGADPRTQPVAPERERRVGLSDELFGDLHGEPSFRRAREPPCSPQARLRPEPPSADGILHALSFFDEDDEPRSSPRARRSAAVGGASTDQQTLLVRRAVAIGGLVLLLILLFVAVRSCASSRKENALKDYNREVSSIVRESDTQVGEPFFQLLGQAGSESPQDLQTNISGYRVQAEAQLKQARSLDVPGEMKGAQQALLMALEFRRDGLGVIAEQIRTALGDEGEAANDAITQIAGQMQAFLASDVLYQARTAPLIKSALDDAEIGGQKIATSQLPARDRVAERADGRRAARAGSCTGGEQRRGRRAGARPARHRDRHRCRSATRRSQPDAPNRIPASRRTPRSSSASPTRARTTSSTSRSTSSIEGGDKPIKASRTVDTVARGATAEASLAARARSRRPARR